jgi:hypothetical protein
MSSEKVKGPTSRLLTGVGSNLILGFLVSALSVLTASANYMAYQAGNTAGDYEAEGDRLLALSNTYYLEANQNIIVDYTMYDGFYINGGVDDFAAQYYQDQFSASLLDSIDRDSLWDEQYYNDMYSLSEETVADAQASFDLANAEDEREAGFQLSMLIAAVGLAFAAYASLLNEENRLRLVFALISFLLLAFSSLTFLGLLAS